MGPAVRQIQIRLDRTTPRERILLGGLAVGALLFAAVSALDYQTRQQDLYAEALSDRASARVARAAAARASQGAPDRAAIQDMQDWGVKATNVAVAQVRIEGLLLDAATRAQLAAPRITSDGELEEIGPTQWINANVETDLKWSPVFTFLDELGRSETGFRVVSFGFEIQRQPDIPGLEPRPPTGRIRMGVAYPVELTGEVAP